MPSSGHGGGHGGRSSLEAHGGGNGGRSSLGGPGGGNGGRSSLEGHDGGSGRIPEWPEPAARHWRGPKAPSLHLSRLFAPKGILLMLPDGSVKLYPEPITVADVEREFPNCHVGSVTTMRSQLARDKVLHHGSTYYLARKLAFQAGSSIESSVVHAAAPASSCKHKSENMEVSRGPRRTTAQDKLGLQKGLARPRGRQSAGDTVQGRSRRASSVPRQVIVSDPNEASVPRLLHACSGRFRMGDVASPMGLQRRHGPTLQRDGREAREHLGERGEQRAGAKRELEERGEQKGRGEQRAGGKRELGERGEQGPAGRRVEKGRGEDQEEGGLQGIRRSCKAAADVSDHRSPASGISPFKGCKSPSTLEDPWPKQSPRARLASAPSLLRMWSGRFPTAFESTSTGIAAGGGPSMDALEKTHGGLHGSMDPWKSPTPVVGKPSKPSKAQEPLKSPRGADNRTALRPAAGEPLASNSGRLEGPYPPSQMHPANDAVMGTPLWDSRDLPSAFGVSTGNRFSLKGNTDAKRNGTPWGRSRSVHCCQEDFRPVHPEDIAPPPQEVRVAVGRAHPRKPLWAIEPPVRTASGCSDASHSDESSCTKVSSAGFNLTSPTVGEGFSCSPGSTSSASGGSINPSRSFTGVSGETMQSVQDVPITRQHFLMATTSLGSITEHRPPSRFRASCTETDAYIA